MMWLGWLEEWYHKKQRHYDTTILWPAIKRQSDDIDSCRAAMALHCFHDTAWLYLGEDEIKRRIGELK